MSSQLFLHSANCFRRSSAPLREKLNGRAGRVCYFLYLFCTSIPSTSLPLTLSLFFPFFKDLPSGCDFSPSFSFFLLEKVRKMIFGTPNQLLLRPPPPTLRPRRLRTRHHNSISLFFRNWSLECFVEIFIPPSTLGSLLPRVLSDWKRKAVNIVGMCFFVLFSLRCYYFPRLPCLVAVVV